ncbi:MAG TPA: nuclear transport factor 2 family protein [Candidatus Krumholzibacteria bacterium]
MPETIIERARVEETINRLFIATDSADWAAVERSFTPLVQLDMSSVGGPAKEMAGAEIAAMWSKGLSHLESVHHQAGNFLIQVNAESASAFCYAIATHYLPNASGRNTRSFTGSYQFELEKNAGRWMIRAMRFNLKYLDGNPDLESS